MLSDWHTNSYIRTSLPGSYVRLHKSMLYSITHKFAAINDMDLMVICQVMCMHE